MLVKKENPKNTLTCTTHGPGNSVGGDLTSQNFRSKLVHHSPFALISVTATISTGFGQKPESQWSFLGKIKEGQLYPASANRALEASEQGCETSGQSCRSTLLSHQYIIGNSSV